MLIAGCSEVQSVVGEHGVYLVGHGFDQGLEEVGRDARGRCQVQLDGGELGGAVDGDER